MLVLMIFIRSFRLRRPRQDFETTPGDEDMQLDADQADRLAGAGAIHGGITELAGIDQGDAAAADDLEVVAGTDERGRVLVQADADGEWVVGQGGQQAPEAVALAEVLVDD